MKTKLPLRRFGLWLALLSLLAVGTQNAAAWPRSDLFPTLREQVQAAYLTYYARSGDPAGVGYWEGRLATAGGDSLEGIVAAFSDAEEFDERYGGKSASQIIDMIYWQLFHRAPDAAGKAYYANLLATGASSVDRIALDILYGAQGEDQVVLLNKLEVSGYFTDRLAESGARFDEETAPQNIALLDTVTGDESTVAAGLAAAAAYMVAYGAPDATFERIATFPVYLNLDAGEDPDSETAAEIVTVSSDGNTLIYSDSPMGRIGFIDITDPASPRAAGFLDMGGEPTSVAVKGDYVLVGVNTSPSYVAPSGNLTVVELSDAANPSVAATIDLGGQPDSVTVSPDGRYAAIAIENERDEDACAAGDGTLIDAAYGDEDACAAAGGTFSGLPQLPAGFLSLIDLSDVPSSWSPNAIDLTGLADVATADPEPEYVAINTNNEVTVTLQENNYVLVVDAVTGAVTSHFSAGSVSLTDIDANENDLIDPIYALSDLAREPDAVTWLFDAVIATANEGDWLGGSRGFTLFDPAGSVLYDAGNSFEHDAIRVGHYPEGRAENKGAEPEGIASAAYGDHKFLFVGSERGNFVEVFRAAADTSLEKVQFLAGGSGPEGLLPIPSRNLFVTAAENDDAGAGIRSLVTIFRLVDQPAEYPGIVSAGAPPIAWGALSALVGDKDDADRLYMVHDSFYQPSRIYVLDVSGHPAVITAEIPLMKDGVPTGYDLEGIAQRADGTFWLASEGGSARENVLIRAAADGTVMEEIELPPAIVAQRTNSGFEGVAVIGSGADERVVLAVQREWGDDPAGYVKIALYTPATATWDFLYYPLDPKAAAGGWVGLSEVTRLPGGEFLVLERDNQQGPKAEVKRLYRIALDDTRDEGLTYPVLNKALARDLMPDLAAGNGWIPDKVEGVGVASDGSLYVVSDNDGLDDAMGETWFLRLGDIGSAIE